MRFVRSCRQPNHVSLRTFLDQPNQQLGHHDHHANLGADYFLNSDWRENHGSERNWCTFGRFGRNYAHWRFEFRIFFFQHKRRFIHSHQCHFLRLIFGFRQTNDEKIPNAHSRQVDFPVWVSHCASFTWQDFANVSWSELSLETWASIAFVVLGATFSVYILNGWALQYVNPSVVGVYIYVQPLLATAIALYFVQGELTWAKVGFAGLIFIGVFLVIRRKKQV